MSYDTLHPNQPTFGRDEVFFFFFFLNFVRSSLLNHKTSKFKFFELQMQFFHPKFFGVTLSENPPEMGPQKINFFNGSS